MNRNAPIEGSDLRTIEPVGGGAFLVGEPLRDNGQGETLYSCFCRTGDNFRARNLTVKQFKEYTA